MTNKLFHSLAILVLAFFAGQAPQSMAQSSRIDSDELARGVPAMRRDIDRGMRAHPPARPNARSQSEAVASGLAKQKVYQFRTVDYPAANSSSANDYDDATAVGNFDFGTTVSAFYFKGTTNSLLNIPGATSSAINGINATGEMVGSYLDPKGHGFLYDGKTITTLDAPGATFTEANGINKSGAIVGDYYDSSDVQHGFLYQQGKFTKIDYPGSGGETVAYGINATGEVVGYYFLNDVFYGFLRNASGVYSSIDFPAAEGTYPGGINDAGAIAGTFFDKVGAHGFTYFDGVFTQVDVGGGAVSTSLTRIKNNKNVVGSYQDTVGESHGIIGK
jgi:probable HAF family extracellular repeat protein